MTTQFQEFFASFTFMPRTMCVSPWWSLVASGFRLGECWKGAGFVFSCFLGWFFHCWFFAMVSCEVTRNSMWIPILRATSSEPKPVLLGTHRKNAQSFWMTREPALWRRWLVQHVPWQLPTLWPFGTFLPERTEKAKQNICLWHRHFKEKRQNKHRSGVKTYRCGILRANEESKWSYWFGWTPKRQVWDACCIMLYACHPAPDFPCCHPHLDDYITHIFYYDTLPFDVRSSANISLLCTKTKLVEL